MKKIIKRIVLVVAILSALSIGGFCLALPHLRTESRMRSCRGQLASLGMVFQLYTQDQGGAFPSNIAQFVSGSYVGSAGVFSCPWDWATNRNPAQVDQWMDYIYVYWPEGTNTPSEYPLLYDRRLSNHAGKGINILLVNGNRQNKGAPRTVIWDTKAEWLKGFARQHPELNIKVPEDAK